MYSFEPFQRLLRFATGGQCAVNPFRWSRILQRTANVFSDVAAPKSHFTAAQMEAHGSQALRPYCLLGYIYMHDDCESRTRPALQTDTPLVAKHPLQTQANVCVVADHGLGATYLSELLQADASIHLVTLADVVAPPEPTLSGTVFVMDYGGLRLPFSQCLLALRQNFPTCRYLALDRERSQEDVMRIMQLGVDGFVSYRDVPAMLIRAVHEVAAGQLWVEAQILKGLLKSRNRNTQVNHAVTYRETQVLELAKGRLTNKEIGSVLGIQESTVKYHLTNIFSKLAINSREELLENPDPTGCWASLLRSNRQEEDMSKYSKEPLYRICKTGT